MFKKQNTKLIESEIKSLKSEVLLLKIENLSLSIDMDKLKLDINSNYLEYTTDTGTLLPRRLHKSIPVFDAKTGESVARVTVANHSIDHATVTYNSEGVAKYTFLEKDVKTTFKKVK